jgi:hypothetical protein
MSMDIDFSEILGRVLKYFFEGIAVGLACYFTPKSKLSMDEIIIIAITAAVTFAILDMYSPRIGDSVRIGAGFGIGSHFSGIRMVG